MNDLDYNNVFNSLKAKADAFDKLAEMYYRKNFGTLPKSEIDLIMFSVYLDAVMKSKGIDAASIDYSVISDQKIAKVLGITPKRVSNYKMRKHLSFDKEEFDFKSNLRNLVLNNDNIRIENEYIVLFIPDAFLYSEIKDCIESELGIADSSFNPQIMRIPQNNYMKLCRLCMNDEEYDDFIKAINTYVKKNPDYGIGGQKDLLDKIEQGTVIGKNIIDILTGALGLVNPGATIIKKLVSIFNNQLGGV